MGLHIASYAINHKLSQTERNYSYNGYSRWIPVEQHLGLLLYKKWLIYCLQRMDLPQFKKKKKKARVGLQTL